MSIELFRIRMLTKIMITHHTQLLNYLISKFELKSYLEIGINNPASNFDKINAEYKHGVDPDLAIQTNRIYGGTSDEFFEMLNISTVETKYDLVFIDGLHTADQVEKDFENSLRCLSPGGFIVIHDTLPDEEIATCVPRGQQKKWFGNVYKFAMNLATCYRVKFVTIDIDCGCTVIWKSNIISDIPELSYDFSWEQYMERRKLQMNIIQPQQIEQTFNELNRILV